MTSNILMWTYLHACACKASAKQPELCFAQVLCCLMENQLQRCSGHHVGAGWGAQGPQRLTWKSWMLQEALGAQVRLLGHPSHQAPCATVAGPKAWRASYISHFTRCATCLIQPWKCGCFHRTSREALQIPCLQYNCRLWRFAMFVF